MTEVARKAGVAPSTLSRIFPTPVVKYTLSARTIRKLKLAFFDTPEADPSLAPEQRRVDARAPNMPQAAPAAQPIFSMMPLRHPDHTDGATLESVTIDFASPSDFWPIAVPGAARDRFVLAYVSSEALAPRIRSGEAILVDCNRPCSIGQDTLVEYAAHDGQGRTFSLGQLVSRTRDEVTIAQPGFGLSCVVHLSRLLAIYPVVGRFDRAAF